MGELLHHNDKETFTVSHRKALSHHMPINHFHNTYEIFYLLSGKREFFIKDRTIVIQAGDLVIIPPNVLHRTTNAESPEHERLIVNVHESLLTAADGSPIPILQPLFEKEYLIVNGSTYERDAVEAIAKQMIQELRDRSPGFEAYMQTLTVQLLIACFRHRSESDAEPPAYPSPMHERISEVVRYMNRHYTEDLSLPLLAEKFYVSPYYLSRFFKEATGFTFVEYLNHVRIKEAMTLLMRSSLKVHLIARKVGFGSVTHFGRVFKQVTGHAPLFYRKGK